MAYNQPPNNYPHGQPPSYQAPRGGVAAPPPSYTPPGSNNFSAPAPSAYPSVPLGRGPPNPGYAAPSSLHPHNQQSFHPNTSTPNGPTSHASYYPTAPQGNASLMGRGLPPSSGMPNMGGPPSTMGNTNRGPPPSSGMPNMGGPPPTMGNTNRDPPPSSGMPNMGGPPPTGMMPASMYNTARGPPLPGGYAVTGQRPPPPPPIVAGKVIGGSGVPSAGHTAPIPVQPVVPPPKIDPSQIPRVPLSAVGLPDAPWSSSMLFGQASDPKTLPPAASKPFTAIDEGNATPRFMRPTLHHFPASKEVATNSGMPLAVVVTPMAREEEQEPNVQRADFSDPRTGGPVRCDRCKAYINCFVSWVKNGDAWTCNMCGMTNTTHPTYRCPIDGTGQRMDVASRPELAYGSVDFVATPSYCVRPVQEPIYVFVIDTTPAAFTCGFTKLLIDMIVQVVEATATKSGLGYEETYDLNSMPPLQGGRDRVRVGIVTFDQAVTFYRLSSEKASEEHVLEVVMGDVNDPFAPLPSKEWVVPVTKLVSRVRALGDHILQQASNSADRALAAVQGKPSPSGNRSVLPGIPSGCMSAALCAVSEGLHVDGGRVMVFSHSAPLIGAGRLRPREHMNDYGTEREPHMWRPLTPNAKSKEDKESGEFYANLGDSCSRRQVSVSMFLTDGGAYGGAYAGTDRRGMMGGYSDIATLGVVPTATGGRMNFFPGSIGLDGQINPMTLNSLRGNVCCSIKAVSANESVLKIRCSEGFRCTEYYGSGVQHHPEEMEIAACDEFASFVCTLKHDTSIKANSRVYVQAALLYSSPQGLRMVRVHTLCLTAADMLADVFRLADLDAIFCANLQSPGNGKGGYITKALTEEPANLDGIRNTVSNTCADALFGYRTQCAKTSPAGQLVLPESLKLFPLYSLGVTKSLCFRDNGRISQGEDPDPRADERAYHYALLKFASPYVTHRLLQPRLFDLATFDPTLEPDSPCVDESEATDNSSQASRQPNQVLAPGMMTSLQSNVATPFAVKQEKAVLAGERMSDGHVALPHPVHCSAAALGDDKVMLLDAGHVIYIWVGRSVDQIIIQELFGVDQLDPEQLPHDLSSGGKVVELIRCAINELRRDMPFYAPLKVILAGTNSFDERRFLSFLIEDKTKQDASYVDYLCQVHRAIQRRM